MRYLLLVLLGLATTSLAAQTEEDLNKAKKDWTTARFLAATGRLDLAISYLRSAIKEDPGSIVYPLEMALIYYKMHRYGKAISKLEPLRFHKDVNATVYQLLARTYFENKQEKDGVVTLEKGLALFPESPLLCSEAGEYYLTKKDTTMAIRCFEKGMRSKSNAIVCYYNAAILHGLQKNYATAMSIAEIGMNMDFSSKYRKDLSILYYHCCRVLFRSGNLPSSIRDSILNSVSKRRNVTSLDTLCQYLLVTQAADSLYKYDETRNKYVLASRASLRQSGRAEAYQYWLMVSGDVDGFGKWRDDNTDKWNEFIAGWNKRRPYVR
ncbi:MAG: hypothetical protein QM731_04315 [Chitinophagaceae bacterium]